MAIVLISFIVLVLIGLPIGYIMGISSLFGLLDMGGFDFLRILVTRMQSGLDDHVLSAIVFFIITSELMNRSGITERLVRFVNRLVGHLPGGLSHANIGVSILFAGLTGTQITDTVAIGKILIPAMKKEGYGSAFSAAVTATSSVLGPIIPPSVVMVIYSSLIRETSVRSLFTAGIMPGIIMGVSLLAISAIQSYRRSYSRHARASLNEILRSTVDALLALVTPLVILGAIILGITTITEAAAIAAAYSLVLGILIYRSLTTRDIWNSMLDTAKLGGVIFLLIVTSHTLGWFITRSGISQQMARFIIETTGNKYVVLLLLNIALLIAGMFVDVIPAAIILVPILAPALAELGFDQLHMAIVMIVNLNIGGVTPPVGMTIMTAAKIADVPYERSVKETLPFLAAHIFTLLIITYFPFVPLWLPRLLGVWGG
jgi:tripartite ATP-independent transporter DctM subunit